MSDIPTPAEYPGPGDTVQTPASSTAGQRDDPPTYIWKKRLCLLAILAMSVPAGVLDACCGGKPTLFDLLIGGVVVLLALAWARMDARQHRHILGLRTQVLILLFVPLGLAWYFVFRRRGWGLLGLIGMFMLFVLGFGISRAAALVATAHGDQV